MEYKISLIATAAERAEHGNEPDTARNRRWLGVLAVGGTLTVSEPETVNWSLGDVSERLARHAKALAPASFTVRIVRSPGLRAVVATRTA